MPALQYNVFNHDVDKLLMTDGGGGRVGPPPSHCSCQFNSQLLMTDRGGGRMGSPHCSCHFNSQLLVTNGGWG